MDPASIVQEARRLIHQKYTSWEWFWIEHLLWASFWLTFAWFFSTRESFWFQLLDCLGVGSRPILGCPISRLCGSRCRCSLAVRFHGGKKIQNVYTIPIWDSFRMGWPSSIELRLPVYFGISERIWIHLANLMDIRCEDFICLDPVRLKSEGVGILEESNWNTFLPNAWCQWLHWSVARGSTGIASTQEANDIHYCSLISSDIMCLSSLFQAFYFTLIGLPWWMPKALHGTCKKWKAIRFQCSLWHHMRQRHWSRLGVLEDRCRFTDQKSKGLILQFLFCSFFVKDHLWTKAIHWGMAKQQDGGCWRNECSLPRHSVQIHSVPPHLNGNAPNPWWWWWWVVALST